MNKITLNGIKNMNMDQINTLKEIDTDMVRDITLTLENNYNFYNSMKNYIISTQKKIKKETYNYSLTIKGMLNITDHFIKNEYIRNYCNNQKISSVLSVNDRIIIARDILNDNINDCWN